MHMLSLTVRSQQKMAMHWVYTGAFSIVALVAALCLPLYRIHSAQLDTSQPWYANALLQSATQRQAVEWYDLVPGQPYSLTMTTRDGLAFRGCALVINATGPCRNMVDDHGRFFGLCHDHADIWHCAGHELTLSRFACDIEVRIPSDERERQHWKLRFDTCVQQHPEIYPTVGAWARQEHAEHWDDDVGSHCQYNNGRFDFFPVNQQLRYVVIKPHVAPFPVSIDDWWLDANIAGLPPYNSPTR
jgi:hypothetical protein